MDKERQPSSGNIISIDEGKIQDYLEEVVRGVVEDTLISPGTGEKSEQKSIFQMLIGNTVLFTATAMFTALYRMGKSKKLLLWAIHACKLLKRKPVRVTEKLKVMKLPKAAGMLLEFHFRDFFLIFQTGTWIRIRTNNRLEIMHRGINRQTKVVGCFPDGESTLMLSAARLRLRTKWSTRQVLLKEMDLMGAG